MPRIHGWVARLFKWMPSEGKGFAFLAGGGRRRHVSPPSTHHARARRWPTVRHFAGRFFTGENCWPAVHSCSFHGDATGPRRQLSDRCHVVPHLSTGPPRFPRHPRRVVFRQAARPPAGRPFSSTTSHLTWPPHQGPLMIPASMPSVGPSRPRGTGDLRDADATTRFSAHRRPCASAPRTGPRAWNRAVWRNVVRAVPR